MIVNLIEENKIALMHYDVKKSGGTITKNDLFVSQTVLSFGFFNEKMMSSIFFNSDFTKYYVFDEETISNKKVTERNLIPVNNM